MPVTGLHHLTAISSDPLETFRFYTQVLGLRLVKKSVNQDDVATYHLFFGNRLGSPGMDLTFFPFQPVRQGHPGSRSVERIGLAVPLESLDFWQARFSDLGVTQQPVQERFGRPSLPFSDNDGQQFELIGLEKFASQFEEEVWMTADVGAEQAIRCFPWMNLHVNQLSTIEPIMQLFGYEQQANDGAEYLYQLPGVESAGELVVRVSQDAPAQLGAGGVHHLAFGVEAEEDLRRFQSELVELGLRPTAVIDRYYFKSVYFQTPAGLFELATLGPGFTADENESQLGQELALPPFLESKRQEIEANLPPLEIETND